MLTILASVDFKSFLKFMNMAAIYAEPLIDIDLLGDKDDGSFNVLVTHGLN